MRQLIFTAIPLSFGSLPEIPAVLFRYRKRHGRCRPRRTSSCPPAPDMFCYYPDIFPPRTECDTLPSRRDAHGTGAHRPVKSLLLQRVSPFRKGVRLPAIFTTYVSVLPFENFYRKMCLNQSDVYISGIYYADDVITPFIIWIDMILISWAVIKFYRKDMLKN